MPEANIIKEHMEVVGSDGVHVGTIDHIEEGRIKLTKAGSSDGQHHYVTTAIVQDIRGNVVTLTKPAAEATDGAVEEDQHGSETSSKAQAIDAVIRARQRSSPSSATRATRSLKAMRRQKALSNTVRSRQLWKPNTWCRKIATPPDIVAKSSRRWRSPGRTGIS